MIRFGARFFNTPSRGLIVGLILRGNLIKLGAILFRPGLLKDDVRGLLFEFAAFLVRVFWELSQNLFLFLTDLLRRHHLLRRIGLFVISVIK